MLKRGSTALLGDDLVVVTTAVDRERVLVRLPSGAFRTVPVGALRYPEQAPREGMLCKVAGRG